MCLDIDTLTRYEQSHDHLNRKRKRKSEQSLVHVAGVGIRCQIVFIWYDIHHTNYYAPRPLIRTPTIVNQEHCSSRKNGRRGEIVELRVLAYRERSQMVEQRVCDEMQYILSISSYLIVAISKCTKLVHPDLGSRLIASRSRRVRCEDLFLLSLYNRKSVRKRP